MKPAEQMIVKLASVLGLIFTRQLLEVISPTNSTWKLRQLLHGMMQSGVFECAASHFNHMGVMQPDSITRHKSSRHHIQKLSHVSCECSEADEGDQIMIGVDIPPKDMQNPVSNCRYLRFTSSLMQETAYDMFLIDQRRRLHRSAALFLESQAHKCDACGGGEFLPGHEAAAGLYVKPISLTASPAKMSDTDMDNATGKISASFSKLMNMEFKNFVNDFYSSIQMRYFLTLLITDTTLREKTSKLFESMQKSIKRRSSKVKPVGATDVDDEDGGEDEDLAGATSDDDEEDEDMVGDLPPVPLEVFGRRGRRNTITVHRSSVAPQDSVDVSGSCIR